MRALKLFKTNSLLKFYLKKVYREHLRAVYVEGNIAVVTDECCLFITEIEDEKVETPRLISVFDQKEYDPKLYPDWTKVIPQEYRIKFDLIHWYRFKTFIDSVKMKYSPEVTVKFSFQKRLNAPLWITKMKIEDTILTFDTPFEIGQVQEIKDNIEDNNENHFYIQAGYIKLLLSFFRPANLFYIDSTSCLTFTENPYSNTKFLVMPVKEIY